MRTLKNKIRGRPSAKKDGKHEAEHGNELLKSNSTHSPIKVTIGKNGVNHLPKNQRTREAYIANFEKKKAEAYARIPNVLKEVPGNTLGFYHLCRIARIPNDHATRMAINELKAKGVVTVIETAMRMTITLMEAEK